MSAPQHCPSPRELDDLELLLGGGYAPRDRFDDEVTLDAPAGELDLVDPEGLPLAHRAADGTLSALSHPEYGAFRRLHLTPAQTRERFKGALFVTTDPHTHETVPVARRHAPELRQALGM